MGERGFSGWSKCKERLDERITKAAGRPLPHWTLHDLRRTCATRMADLAILPHVIEAVLNHVSGHKSGVAGIYNRALYEPEKRQALALWTDRVMALVDGRSSNVTVLKRA
jgi:integrase